MKRFFSFLSIILILNNVFFIDAFAWNKLDLNLFTVKVNSWTDQNWDVEAKPWDTLHLLLSGRNAWDELANVKWEFSFSSNNFTYTNKWQMDSYKNWVLENENIDTNTFDPPSKNTAPIASVAPEGTYFDLYYFDLIINADTSDNVLTLWGKLTSDSVSSSTWSRNVYINSNPHIIDYYFEKSWTKTTSLKRWWEQVDFVLKVKDYNGCSNIDGATVKANLSKLWLGSSESLSFVSCSSLVATYKKSGITTLVPTGTLSFVYWDFSATDENGHVNKPNDSSTSFDNEDKKDNLNLAIASAGTPVVSATLNDNYIWSSLNNSAQFSFSWEQNWSIKINLWGNGVCESGTVLKDWTSWYTANTASNFTINASSLSTWNNSIYACLKNDENKIWSANLNIFKDITVPLISSVVFSPVNVVANNSGVMFVCSEDWKYQIEKGWNGNLSSGSVLSSGNVVANVNNNIVINNSGLSVWWNDVYVYCLDKASNYVSYKGTVNKTTPPPSLASISTSFYDGDTDYDWIDGRDFTFTWNNTTSKAYTYFESYRLYILPSNITFNASSHSYIKLLGSKDSSSFTWDETIIKDSLWSTFVSGWSYKMCVAVMWSNGILSTPGCSAAATVTWDTVTHPKVLDAKFTTDTNLEITTDATLDTNIASHSWSLITFTYNSKTSTGISVSSVNGKKLNVTINSLNNIGALGTNLLSSTWAIRANGGWFNNTVSLFQIKDGQVPTVTSFTKTTSSSYNNFYTGSVNFSYNFWENMKNSYTKFEIAREWWNPDSGNYNFAITGNNIMAWSHDDTLDLKALWLKDGSYYKVRIVWEDIAWNYVASSYISDVRFDSKGPDSVTKNEVALYSTAIPALSWNTPSDNAGKGSWVKEYKLKIYNGKTCAWNALQEYTVVWNSKNLSSLTDVADYSWKILWIDNMWNIWEDWTCSIFRVDTRKPVFSNSEIKDSVIDSVSYLKKWNNIKVKSSITDTDISHIWADISMFTWNSAHSAVSCSAPATGITCSFASGVVTYSFAASSTLTDGVKQVSLKAQNTSGWNESVVIFSSTADSTPPVIASDALSSPTGTVWWTGTTIVWNTSQVSDTIWLNNIRIEYSTWTSTWASIWVSPNNGSFVWNLNGIASWNNYKLRFTASDLAWNEFAKTFSTFIIDRTNPVVPNTTLTQPNGAEIIKWNSTYTIKWSSGSITDSSLKTNPISLYYSIDNGVSFASIADNLANSWTYNWSVPWVNSDKVLVKLVAYDTVWNFASDVSNATFIVDSTNPSLAFTYTNTPANGSYINNSWIDVTGTTGDSYFSKLYYKFQNTSDSTFYNGTAFTGAETWVNVCSDPTAKWTNGSCNNISFALKPTVVDWKKYKLILKTTDEAWNESLTVPLEYTWDIVNPTLNVTTASWTYYKNTINIAGTTSDAWSQVSSVKIQIKKWNTYWNGTSFVSWVQTLNTSPINTYANWTYSFNYSWADSAFEVNVIAYDSSYKVNNSTTKTITINKDATVPSITGGVWLFTSPSLNSIHIWWTNIAVSWNSWSITDGWSGLKTTPIKLEYFNGSTFVLIKDNELNDGSYAWNSIPSLDLNNVKIRLTASDNVGNVKSQLSNVFTIDSTAPTIAKVETMDMNANGQIDALNVTMSESIKDSTITLANFTLSDSIWTPISWETWASANDANFVLKFNDTLDTSSKPTLSYTKWALTDIAWKFLETVSKSSVDKAVPRILKSELFDDNGNGKFDKLVVDFSENVLAVSDVSTWSFANVLSWMSFKSVSVSSKKATFVLNESSVFDTSVWSMKLNFSSHSSWKDNNANTLWGISNMSIWDKAKPVVVSAEYFDLNWNYKVDKVKLTLSENVLWFNNSDFSTLWLVKNTSTVSWKEVWIDIVETSSDHNTGVSATFSFTTWNLKDVANNFVVSAINKVITDKVVPKLLSVETGDSNGNGKIDFMQLAYSEKLNTSFWSFVWEVDAYTTSGYGKINDSIVRVNVTEKSYYDSHVKPTVKVTSNTSLADMSGNLVKPFSPVVSTDKVWPVIVWAKYDKASHKMLLEFSETINSTDFITSNVVLNNAWSASVTGVNFSEKSITLSSETINYLTTTISFKANSVRDTFGNKQTSTSFVKVSPPIVINEVMVSNTASNNYVELKNLSISTVNIWWFKIAGVTIPTGTTIASGWYYLLSKGIKSSSIINVNPDYVSASLDLSWTQIALNNGVMDIDYAKLDLWLLEKTTPKSMERMVITWDGKSAAHWYTAQVSNGFDSSSSYGTPSTKNVHDSIAPTVSSYFPTDSILLSYPSPTVEIHYSDNVGWLWVKTSSDTLKLYKWNGSSWGSNIASSYVDFAGKAISTTKATYKVNNLPYGKYKADFSIADNANNTVNKSIVFYVDNIEFSIDREKIDIWNLMPNTKQFYSSEVTLTVKTVWAWFKLNMKKAWNFSSNGVGMVDFDGNYGFGFDKYNSWYSGNITSMWNAVELVSQSESINTDGNKNTYTYKIKYWAKASVIQAAWVYTTKPNFELLLDY
jgi:hypothetical protein